MGMHERKGRQPGGSRIAEENDQPIIPYAQIVSVRTLSSTMRVVADISLVTLTPLKLKNAMLTIMPQMARMMM